MTIGLQARVDQALAQARENGFDLFGLADPCLIACDLMDCDADFERENFDEVAACCLQWLLRQEGRDHVTIT